MKLYDYFRSSAAYRVRIALNIKQIVYESNPINLRTGEQNKDAWTSINPQGLVPLLVTNEGRHFTQSLAIIEWLEEVYPSPCLLPRQIDQRCKIRSLAAQVASDLHPINNLRVLNYLKNTLQISEEQKQNWYHHWVKIGFAAFEKQIDSLNYCFENQVTMADVCLIPQVYNALRFKVDMQAFPKIYNIYQHCMNLTEFEAAAPENQSDAC